MSCFFWNTAGRLSFSVSWTSHGYLPSFSSSRAWSHQQLWRCCADVGWRCCCFQSWSELCLCWSCRCTLAARSYVVQMSENTLYIPINRKKCLNLNFWRGSRSLTATRCLWLCLALSAGCYRSCRFLGVMWSQDYILLHKPQLLISSINSWKHQLLGTSRAHLLAIPKWSNHTIFEKVLCVSVLLPEQRLKQKLLQGKPNAYFQRALALIQHLRLSTHEIHFELFKMWMCGRKGNSMSFRTEFCQEIGKELKRLLKNKQAPHTQLGSE